MFLSSFVEDGIFPVSPTDTHLLASFPPTQARKLVLTTLHFLDDSAIGGTNANTQVENNHNKKDNGKDSKESKDSKDENHKDFSKDKDSNSNSTHTEVGGGSGGIHHRANSDRLITSPLASENILSSELLPTAAHIYYVMESLSHCLTLPFDDHLYISQALNVYQKWLFSNYRPKPISNNPTEFIPIIAKHLSMLFDCKRTVSANQTVQIQLCNRVISIYTSLAKNTQAQLNDECWLVLIKILLGICLHVYKSNTVFAQAIENQLSRCFFDILLKSGTNNTEIWKLLHVKFPLLLHKKCVLNNWRICLYTISNRVFQVLASTTNPAASINTVKMNVASFNTNTLVTNAAAAGVTTPNSVQNTTFQLKWTDTIFTSLNYSNKQLIYAWSQILNLLGSLNINSLRDSDSYNLIIQTQADLIEQLLLPKQFDLNTILDIFGPVLFDSIQNKYSIQVLCKLFARPNKTVIFQDYLTSFYRSVITVLSTQASTHSIISALIPNISSLFLLCLPSSLTIAPSLVPHFQFILSTPDYALITRRSCIQIINSLLSLYSHMFIYKLGIHTVEGMTANINNNSNSSSSSPKLNSLLNSAENPNHISFQITSSRYKSQLGQLPSILLNSLTSESDYLNIEATLCGLATHCYEECLFATTLLQTQLTQNNTNTTNTNSNNNNNNNASANSPHNSNTTNFNHDGNSNSSVNISHFLSLFPHQCIQSAWKIITEELFPLRTLLLCFDFLCNLAQFHSVLHGANGYTIPDLIQNLVIYIEKKSVAIVSAGNSAESQAYIFLTTHAYCTLYYYVNQANWLLSNTTLSNSIIKVVDIGMKLDMYTETYYWATLLLRLTLLQAGLTPLTPNQLPVLSVPYSEDNNTNSASGFRSYSTDSSGSNSNNSSSASSSANNSEPSQESSFQAFLNGVYVPQASSWSEESLIEYLIDNSLLSSTATIQNSVQCFLLHQTVLISCVVTLNEECWMIIRDITGKYVFKTQANWGQITAKETANATIPAAINSNKDKAKDNNNNLNGKSLVDEDESDSGVDRFAESLLELAEDTDKLLEMLDNSFNNLPENDLPSTEFLKYIEMDQHLQAIPEMKTVNKFNQPALCKRPTATATDKTTENSATTGAATASNSSLQVLRLLLSNLGFFSRLYWPPSIQISLLDSDLPNKQTLLRDQSSNSINQLHSSYLHILHNQPKLKLIHVLHGLDAIPETDQYRAAVIYRPTAVQNEEEMWLETGNQNPHYQWFLNELLSVQPPSLQWQITSNMKHSTTSTEKEKQIKSYLLHRTYVRIIYCEDCRDITEFRIQAHPDGKPLIYILITPTVQGLYRCRIISSNLPNRTGVQVLDELRLKQKTSNNNAKKHHNRKDSIENNDKKEEKSSNKAESNEKTGKSNISAPTITSTTASTIIGTANSLNSNSVNNANINNSNNTTNNNSNNISTSSEHLYLTPLSSDQLISSASLAHFLRSTVITALRRIRQYQYSGANAIPPPYLSRAQLIHQLANEYTSQNQLTSSTAMNSNNYVIINQNSQTVTESLFDDSKASMKLLRVAEKHTGSLSNIIIDKATIKK